MILTRPSSTHFSQMVNVNGPLKHDLRYAARCLRDSYRQKQSPFSFSSGHSSVTRYLTGGLRNSGLDFTFNPLKMVKEQSITVGVLAGMDTLSWATRVAQQGTHMNMVVGPNVFERPLDAFDLLMDDSVKHILLPSRWVLELCKREAPDLTPKLCIWMSGIDSDYWSPPSLDDTSRKQKILIYVKSLELHVVQQVREVCMSMNYRVQTLHAGKYSRRHFLESLRESTAMIVIGGFESQGLAMFEAWSVNVPTFVWQNPTPPTSDRAAERCREFRSGTEASPYLSQLTGRFWRDTQQLENQIRMLSTAGLRPREWILENAQSAECAKRYYDLLKTAHLSEKL